MCWLLCWCACAGILNEHTIRLYSVIDLRFHDFVSFFTGYSRIFKKYHKTYKKYIWMSPKKFKRFSSAFQAQFKRPCWALERPPNPVFYRMNFKFKRRFKRSKFKRKFKRPKNSIFLCFFEEYYICLIFLIFLTKICIYFVFVNKKS